MNVYGKTHMPAPVFDEREWTLAWSQNTESQRFEEYTLKHESIKNWSELITMQFFPGNYNVLKYTQDFEKKLKKSCPNIDFSYAANKEDPNSIMWTFQSVDCPGYKNHIEIARAVVQPNVGIHIFHYATTDTNLSDKDFQTWLIKLFSIKIDRD